MSADNERRARELMPPKYHEELEDGLVDGAPLYEDQQEWVKAEDAFRAITTALDKPAGSVDGWQHVANEYADMATSGIQWLRNIRDGISTPEEAIKNMMECLKHCEQVSGSKAAALAQPQGREAQAVDLDQFREAVELWKLEAEIAGMGLEVPDERIAKADRLLTLIDAQSAKGDGDA